MLKVYFLRVSDYDAFPEDRLKKRVSGETQAVAATFRNEKVRRLKWLGEGLVRSLMESEFHLRPESYQILRGEHGKPYIRGTGLPFFFNLSHSGDYIICGCSDREIGVDIQCLGAYRPEVVRRFFHPGEIRKLEECRADERRTLFFRYWAAKESFLKYTGTGLSASLSGFEISFEEKEVKILKTDFQQRIYLQACPIDEEYACFVCSESPDAPEIIPFRFAGL